MTRRLIHLRGAREEVVAQARGLAPDALWVSAEYGIAPSAVRGLLGQSHAAVVVDLADGIRFDLLGAVHGLILGGGALVLLDDDDEHGWVPPWEGLVVSGVVPGQRALERVRGVVFSEVSSTGALMVPGPSAEQDALVDRLVERWQGPRSVTVVIADRGRGKSVALGRALERLGGGVVTGPWRRAADEVLKFSPSSRLVPADSLSLKGVLVVDEAAGLSVPLLQLLASHSDHVVFATTVHGYEGSGRGFLLRFLPWLRRHTPTLQLETLETPIRWAAGDLLEAWIRQALALDCEPTPIEAGGLVVRRVEQDELANDEDLLRGVFGLLVSAHYRTTPSDLQRILDAPNLHLHVAMRGQSVVGATLIAEEGGLPEGTAELMIRGARVRGHALPETLICQSGRREAAPLRGIRSVRLATHPEARRQGIATKLVEHVHATYSPDWFGTMFGATPEVLRFRRSLGYEVVRVGSARGARTGEPTAVMLSPRSDAARSMMHTLRAELGRDWSTQATLLNAGPLPVRAELVSALGLGLSQASPWTTEDLAERVDAYASGCRPFEAVAPALAVASLPLPEPEASLLAGLLDGGDWFGLSKALGFPSVPAAMRALRRAVRASL